MASSAPGRLRTALAAPWSDRRGAFSPLKAATLALTFVPGLWLVGMLATSSLGPLPFGFLLYQTGLWSLWFLVASLAVTPARTIFGWNEAIALRRMLGLAGLAYTLAHCALYFNDRWPLVPRFTSEFMRRPTIPVAIAATVGLILLGLTSFDGAIRAMGARAWNQLHNLAYPAIGLAVLHYAMSPFSVGGPPFVMAGVFVWLMAWRGLNRFRRGADPVALAVLAVGAGLFTFAFAVGWLAWYQERPLLPQVRLAFGLAGGLAPEWQVLATGLALALLAARFGTGAIGATRTTDLRALDPFGLPQAEPASLPEGLGRA